MTTPTDPSSHDPLDAVIADYLQKVEAGTPPDRDALLAAHPELTERLRTFFADLDRVGAHGESFRLPEIKLPEDFGDCEFLGETGRVRAVLHAREVLMGAGPDDDRLSVTALAFDRDGRRLMSAHGGSEYRDATTVLWELPDPPDRAKAPESGSRASPRAPCVPSSRPVTSVVMSDVTRLLDATAAGDRKAAADLLPLVYAELRALADARLAAEAPGHTLQPTALVHEAYLRLVGSADARRWDHRGHFFAAAAEAMRRVLIDHARRRDSDKRGAGLVRIELSLDVPAPDPDPNGQLLALDEALTRLASEDPVAARVVELRQFAGLGHEDVAATLGITVYVARQKWAYARAWLADALSD